MIDGVVATLGIYAATLVVATLSGLIPVVNAELYLIGVAIATNDPWLAVILGLIVALGQMIGKALIYQASRGASNFAAKKRAGSIHRARALVERWRDKPLILTFVSATAGLPPFFIVSILAGLLEIRFRSFLILGFAGRSVRFVTIALLAVLV